MSKDLKSQVENPDLTSRILEVFSNKKYSQLAYDNKLIYKENKPYPHIAFDDFLPLDVANTISNEYPSLIKRTEEFKFHDHKYTNRHLLEDTTKFSTNLQLFTSALSSRSFLLFLETLTGIKSLTHDPYFMGGGAMITNQGGHLNVHIDFNWHQKLQLWRRCNVLFYLTQDWKDEYEGKLEIWSKDGKKKVKEVAPLFNRVVIFTTTSYTWHGQPEPIIGPKDKPQRVFLSAYYSSERGEQHDSPHYTRYLNDHRKNEAEFENSPFSSEITLDYLKEVIKK
jgi:Rps23 Pro-64 3,4-dihydroxylase Tpa1-like proline 4-hydroxylase